LASPARADVKANQLVPLDLAIVEVSGSTGEFTTLSCDEMEANCLALTPFGLRIELPAVGAEDSQSSTVLLVVLPSDDPLILSVKLCSSCSRGS
jgi:hypothetical protein